MNTANINRLVGIMALLRDPDKGCPWDVEQTFASIVPHTIEEAYEVADAIEQEDMDALKDELGDLLLQVVFHARIAEEDGIFDLDGVAGAICDKLVRRHPHVFGDAEVDSAEAQLKAWENYKAKERGTAAVASALDDVTLALPSLTRADKLQKRAARVGFDWAKASDAMAKLSEETAELERELSSGDDNKDRLLDEVGDILFTAVNISRKLDIDPETALRHANSKFECRFRRVETLLAEDGKSPENSSLEEMEKLWKYAKNEE